MLDYLKELWKDPTFRKIFYLFLGYKALVIAVSIFSLFLLPSGISMQSQITENPFLNMWAQYDGQAYLYIAENGYDENFLERGNYGWYPFYPFMIKAFGFIGYDLAAFMISNIFSLLAITLLYIFVKQEFGSKIASKTSFLVLFFPTSYFLTAMYTESIFLTFVLATFIFAKQQKWPLAGLAGFLAALTRMQGAILFVPLIFIYFNKKDRKIDKNIFFIFLVPLGILTFMTYQYFTLGDFFAQFQTQENFYRSITFPWNSIITWFIWITEASGFLKIFYLSFTFLIAISFILLAYFVFRKMGYEYSSYVILSLLLPLSSGTLEAMTRFVLVLFPCFILVAIKSEKDKRFNKVLKIIYVIFIILLVLMTLRHVNKEILLNF